MYFSHMNLTYLTFVPGKTKSISSLWSNRKHKTPSVKDSYFMWNRKKCPWQKPSKYFIHFWIIKTNSFLNLFFYLLIAIVFVYNEDGIAGGNTKYIYIKKYWKEYFLGSNCERISLHSSSRCKQPQVLYMRYF